MTTGISELYVHPSSAETAATGAPEFDTTLIQSVALDITVSALTGGTAPTITFFLERLGLDGKWYPIFSPTAVSAPGTISADIGAFSLAVATATHAVFTKKARLRWAFGGTANPTSVTFSASIVGRS
jgi:hypothetical protein